MIFAADRTISMKSYRTSNRKKKKIPKKFANVLTFSNNSQSQQIRRIQPGQPATEYIAYFNLLFFIAIYYCIKNRQLNKKRFNSSR